jgi:asparagine synthase (glutamine-hydrolysing)
MIMSKGQPKSILKKLLAPRTGDKFVKRKKMGFTPPLSAWMRMNHNFHWIEQSLTNSNSFVYSLFEPNAIRQMIRLHRNGENHSLRIWRLLFLNEWHRRYYT